MVGTVICNMILIALICVNIIDISGFIQEMEKMIGKWLNIRNVRIPKPFSCAYCFSHWVNLIYLLASGHLSLGFYSIALLISFITPEIETLERLMKDILVKILNSLYKLIER